MLVAIPNSHACLYGLPLPLYGVGIRYTQAMRNLLWLALAIFGVNVLTGADTATTYATTRRARDLFDARSGRRALEARTLRLENAVATAVGRDELLVDERHIEGLLAEEDGR